MHTDRIIIVTCVCAALLLHAATRAQSAGAASVRRPPASRPAGAEVFSPHESKKSCGECHAMRGAEALPIPKADVDRTCLSCHNGKLSHAERHPIGRNALGEGLVLPKGWPAHDGRIGCLTCHDLTLTEGHGRSGEPPLDNPDILRGPITDVLTFCSQCHVGNTRQARHNPHRQLNARGQVDEQSCRFCHTRAFTPDQLTSRRNEPALKADAITLCIGCHTRHVDFFEPGHIGATATPAIIAHMAAADRAARAGDAARQDDKQIKPLTSRLPLGPNATLVCSTCHNPHQAGVLPATSVLALGAIPLGPLTNETKTDRKPLKDSTPVNQNPALLPAVDAQHPFQPTAPVRLGANLCGECHGK